MDPEATDRVTRVPHGGSEDLGLIDFSVNVNPVVPDGVEAVYRRAFEGARAYPPEPPEAYAAAAAEYVGCDPERVIPTAGGLEAIRLVVSLTVSLGDSVLLPAPSFSEYAREVRLQGGRPSYVEHDRIVRADPAGHALAVVCNPNNPTGDAYAADDLRDFARACREAGTTLLVDEAFLGFTDRPSMAGVEGVVVARSLTKLFGLPGLRAGFAVATGRLGDRLAAARRPWNLGTPALSVGAYCMLQESFVDATRERVRRERERMRTALADRFEVHPSVAPFLLLDVGKRDVDGVVRAARDRGIAIRDARTFERLDSHIRVAVRLPDENDRLLEALADV